MSPSASSLLRVPRSKGTRAYIALLVAVLIALVLVAVGHWRRGVVVLGSVFMLAAVLRAALPDAQKGLLGVRAKGFDVVWTAFLGVSLVVLAIIVPAGPDES